MSLATRLVIGLSLVVVLVMGIYGMTSLRQREALIGNALVRETEALAQALQIVANSAIRNQQVASLDRVLGRILQDPEMAIAAVRDSAGRRLAGGPPDRLPCADSPADGNSPLALYVWADCGERVRLVVLPLEANAGSLVLARRTTIVDRDRASSRQRILLTSVALAVLASLAIVIVLRFTLTRPLSEILSGVRQLGGPSPPSAVNVPRSARELQDLANAFNEMVERLEGKRQSLVREVEDRIELERRLRKAETFAALGRLTGGMAHELGSPLGVIGMRAEAIQAAPAAAADVRRHAQEISEEVDRISRLVRDLIHVARRHGPDMVPVDLAPLTSSVIGALRPEIEQAGIELETRLPSGSVCVRGDATLLRHALYNVMLNAVQALKKHPGTRRLKVELQPAGEVVRLVVDDTGPGIAPEHYPHLFEPFFTTKDVGEGSGLGLSISSGIIEEHGGILTLVPSPSGGVRVHLDLPTLDPEPENER